MQRHIDVVAMPANEPPSMGSMGPLGPMAGAWDGYADLGPEESMRAKALVGHIHAQTENCARAVVEIGMRLKTLKELLPHGKFMPCVKAEFGWSQWWANQLMQVAERFSNCKSTCNLPSSAQVLALLAASDADDATVEQAAQERWTVAETKRRVRNASSPRQPQPADAWREGLDLEALEQIATSGMFLAGLQQIEPGRRCPGSYALKHRIERWAGRYIREGALIAAAVALEVPLKRHGRDHHGVVLGLAAAPLAARLERPMSTITTI